MDVFLPEDVFRMIESGITILASRESKTKSPARFRPDMYWPRKDMRDKQIDWKAYCDKLFD